MHTDQEILGAEMEYGPSDGGFEFNAKASIPKKKLKSATEEDTTDTLILNARAPIIDNAKIEQMRAEYSKVVVNDFGDDYHLSEAEKGAKSQYYEIFSKVTRCKKKYRKLSEYVRVFRLHLDCLNTVAQTNGVYDPDEFRAMVARGDIHVYGLEFPRYVGKDKREINWDYISEFISQRHKDPSELDNSDDDFDDYYDDEDSLEELRRKLFTDEDYETLFGDGEEDKPVLDEDGFEIRDETDENVVKVLTDKQVKGLVEAIPEIQTFVKEMKRKKNDDERLRTFAYDTTQSDFEYIQSLDTKRGYLKAQPPMFKGDIMNDDDYHRYLLKLEEWEDENIKVNHEGKMKPVSEVKELELKEMLESNGWNIRAIYKNKQKEKALKKADKRDRDREKRIKKELIRINDRRKKRGIDDDDDKKKKKGKKKDKKLSSYKKERSDAFDDILLDGVTREDYDDFNDYKDDMLNFSSDNIFK